jgi:threonylcarbamoyladenosine tRNA methylthiotransferase MtaB
MTDSRTKKKALVHVLGCKVNQAEAAAMTGILESSGYQVDQSADNPDLVLVNTCCVTLKAEGKSRRAVKRLRERYPSARLVVTGCLAEMNPRDISGIADNITVLGTAEKDRFRLHVHSGFKDDGDHQSASGCTTFVDLGFRQIPGRSRNFLKIQDGCSQRCSYCIVPIARGPSRSLPPEAVLEQTKEMAALGSSEIVLTGIHLGSYGKDLRPAMKLEELLRTMIAQCPAVRFRLSSIEPQELTPAIVQLAAENPGICRHFHIPLQSGDDKILSVMGRPYRTEFIRRLIRSIYSAIPDACIGLDVMVGFPGEDEESFNHTFDLIRKLAPSYLHVFPFSARPGTRAASFKPRVSTKLAAERVDRLRELSADLRRQFYSRFLRRSFVAVPESEPNPKTRVLTARTDNYIPVRVKVSDVGKVPGMFEVVLEEIAGEAVFGVVSDDE